MSKKDIRSGFVMFYLIITAVMAVVLAVLQLFDTSALGLLGYLFVTLVVWGFVLDEDKIADEFEQPAEPEQ